MPPNRKELELPKHIGIVACSAEGAALCYRTICMEASVPMGEHMHPELSMHTYPLGKYMMHIRSGNWKEVSTLMLSSVRKLAQIGADFAICPDNTIHQAFDLVVAESPIPWLHIAESVAQDAVMHGFQRLAIIGTDYLMIGPVYPKIFDKFGISFEIPNKSDRERINTIIFKELVNGIFLEQSRLYLNEVIKELKRRGCDAVVLGCTEIPLLVDANNCPLPTLDSTRLLAKAALKESMKVTDN